LLSPADFAELATAVTGMKVVEIASVHDGADLVKAAIPLPQLNTWRDGLAAWAAKASSGVGAATFCSAGGQRCKLSLAALHFDKGSTHAQGLQPCKL